jgi:hypothetical protein
MNNDKDILRKALQRQNERAAKFNMPDDMEQRVMERVSQKTRPSRIVRMWPWLAVACVVGFLIIFLKPPKTTIEQAPKEEQLVAKVKTAIAVEEKHEELKTPVPHKTGNSDQKPRPSHIEEPDEETVQMSEETRMELLLAMASQYDEMPQMEETDTYDEIRQIRMRGERMKSMYEENDK